MGSENYRETSADAANVVDVNSPFKNEKNNTGLRSQNASVTNSSPIRKKPNMSSPFGVRTTNLNHSPGKWSQSSSPRRRDTKSASAVSMGSPFTKPILSFTIFEDKVAPHRDINGTPLSNKINHNDQENILQPKKTSTTIPRMAADRKPLSNLSITDFPGYVGGSALTELYQPPNFENDFKSIHKFLGCPSYVSPVKKDRYLVETAAEGVFSGFRDADNDSNEVFDLENPPATPTKSHKSLLTTHMIRKHRRSLSVGKNDSKLKLIRKNNFSILST